MEGGVEVDGSRARAQAHPLRRAPTTASARPVTTISTDAGGCNRPEESGLKAAKEH